MDVRVDEHLERRVGERADRLQRFLGDLSVLGVHQQHAVRSEQHHGPAAGPVGMRGIETFRSMQHEEIRRHLRRHHDLDLVPRRLIAGRKRERALAGRDELDRIAGRLHRRRRGGARERKGRQDKARACFQHDPRIIACLSGGQTPRQAGSCRFCMERGEHRDVRSCSLDDDDRSSMLAPDRLKGGRPGSRSAGENSVSCPR